MGGSVRIAGVLGYDDASGQLCRAVWPEAWNPALVPPPLLQCKMDVDLHHDPVRQVCRRTPGPVGLNDEADFAVTPPQRPATEAARELELLRKVYGRITSRNNNNQYRRKDPVTKQVVDNVDEYLMDRTAYIGPDYATFRSEALAELQAKPGLRLQLEPPAAQRKRHPMIWEEAQTTFYCWVRRGILLALAKAGRTDVSVPATILGGMTEELKLKLAKVRAQYKGAFSAGGYNARPMKGDGGYRLGTISEHGLGIAVDVNHATNAHIGDASRWMKLQEIAGVLPIASRAALWKTRPRDVYDNVKSTSDGFAKALATAIAEAEKAEKRGDDAIREVMAKDARFKAVGFEFLKRWPGGFFDLEWDLVKAFFDAGFVWGATFGTVDLHHFEM